MAKAVIVRHGEAKVALPSTWHDATCVTLIGPAGAGPVRPNVVATREPVKARSLKAHGEEQRKALESFELPGLKVLESGLEKLGKTATFHLCFQWERRDGKDKHTLRQDQYFFLGKKEALTVTFTCGAGAHDKLKGEFKLILEQSSWQTG